MDAILPVHWRRPSASSLMKVLIATDAWRPQVNGVIHTLEETTRAAEALGASLHFLNAEGFPTVGLPTYPGIRVALPTAREIARRIVNIDPQLDPHRNRRADRPFRPGLLRGARTAVHHKLAYPFRRLFGGALADPAGMDVALAALVPQCRPVHHGVDHLACGGIARSRISCSVAVAARS